MSTRRVQQASAAGPDQGSRGNPSIVVTQPAGARERLLHGVRARGLHAVSLPGLALRAPTDSDRARRALRAAARAQVWIFSSPAAVRFAFRLVRTPRIPRGVRVFAVGSGTRRALARAGIAAIGPDRRGNSEILLGLPGLRQVRGQRIALIGAAGGRGLIAPALRRRGAQVEEVHVYERVPPRLTRRHFDRLAHAPAPWFTLVSSGEALANLVGLLPADLLARLRGQTLVASSPRLAGLARRHGFATIVEAASASPDHLLEAAQTASARRRT